MDIGELTGAVSIEDQFSSVFDSAMNAVQQFASQFEEQLGVVGVVAGTAATAVAGIATAIVALGVEGSHVEDVENAFNRMEGGVDNVQSALERMREATHGTQSDMTLMTAAAKIMQAGVAGTADTLGTVMSAAFIMAKNTGTDFSSSLAQVSTAVERGTARFGPLKQSVTDTQAAESQLTSSLALQGLSLDPANKLIADRQGMMQYLTGFVAKAGDQELTFKDKIDQGKVSFSNWLEELEKTVAQSPELNQVLVDLGTTLLSVFGDSPQTAVKTITSFVASFAQGVEYAGAFIASMAAHGVESFDALETVVYAIETAIMALVTGLVIGIDKLVELGGKLKVVSPEDVKQFDDFTEGLKQTTAGLAEETKQAALGAEGQAGLSQKLEQTAASLLKGAEQMGAHVQVTQAHTDATQKDKTATDGAAGATDNHTKALDKDAVAAAAAASALKQHTDAVSSQVKAFVNAAQGADITSEAISKLTDTQTDNIAVQQKLETAMNGLLAVGVQLSDQEEALYQKIVNTKLATDSKDAAFLESNSVTLQTIESMKKMGLSEQEIAEALGVTVQGLKQYESQLKSTSAFEAENLKASEELWKQWSTAVFDNLVLSDYDKQKMAIQDLFNTAKQTLDEWEKKEIDSAGAATPAITAEYNRRLDILNATSDQRLLHLQTTDAMADKSSQAYYQNQELAAKAAYDHAVTMTGVWSDATIQKYRDTYENAEIALNGWVANSDSAIDQVVSKQDTLTGAINKTTQALSNQSDMSMKAYSGTGGSSQALAAVIKDANMRFGLSDKAVGSGTTSVATMNAYEAYIQSRMQAQGFAATGAVGFAEGGVVTVGENGPERVALPYGSAVYPNGTGPAGSGGSGGGDTYNINVTQPLGSPRAIAEAVDQAIAMRKRQRGERMPLGL